ncbi:spinster family MFS transporter [Sphingomonas profundi]|uniref:spinster family MFS transporter n=1 Tax=Alterirhizorhabdus profundi TaxID=2681549 RepID=UPI0018D19A3C|nr:MFS transporter [Sphingomonas profundi]
MLAVLTAIYTFSSIDRTLLSVLAEPIKNEFHLSDGELGALTGLAFAVAYALAGIPLGLMLDRMSRVRVLGGLLAIWSGMTLLTGFANSAFHMLLARIGVAASESGASPASMGIITDYFPKERRGLALSVFYASAPIAVGITFAAGSAVAAAFGWRAAFMLAALPGLILAPILILTVREPLRGRFDGQAGPRRPPASLDAAIKALLAHPALLWLILGAVCVVVAQAGLSAFMSPFLIRVHDLSLDQAGSAVGLANGPSGVIGILVGGVLADRLSRISTHAAPQVVGSLMLVTAMCALGALMVSDWHVAVALVAAYTFFLHTYYGTTFATYMSVAPVAMRGALAALLAVLMNLGGYGFGPPLTGIASDMFAALGHAQPLRSGMIFVSLFFVLGSFGFYAAARSIRRMPIEDLGVPPSEADEMAGPAELQSS